MESRNLYQDDLTEERQITPAQRDDVARTQALDPDVLDQADIDDTGDDDDDDDELEDEEEDEADDDD
jgi:hypothetical protein